MKRSRKTARTRNARRTNAICTKALERRGAVWAIKFPKDKHEEVVKTLSSLFERHSCLRETVVPARFAEGLMAYGGSVVRHVYHDDLYIVATILHSTGSVVVFGSTEGWRSIWKKAK